MAQADLDDIWERSFADWGFHQAEAYLNSIQAAAIRVADTPSLRRSCDDIRPGYFKALAGSHALFYTAKSGELVIMRVLHQSMDF